MSSDNTRTENLDRLREEREQIERRIYADQQLLRKLHLEISDEVTAIAEGR